jgi:hypothetical protein
LRLMQSSLRSRLCRMPNGRHVNDERRDIRFGSSNIDGSSHQNWNATFTSVTPQDLQHLRFNKDTQKKTQYATHGSKTKYASLYAKGHSVQPDIFSRTHHTKSEQKWMRVMPLCLLASHTSGPRDVPRCGALSLLQKTPHYRGGRRNCC